MSIKDSLGMATQDKKRKETLLAPKSGKITRGYLKQICIHGLARQACFACGGGSPNKPHAKGGIHYGK